MKLAQGVGSRILQGANTINFIFQKIMSEHKNSRRNNLMTWIHFLKDKANLVTVTLEGWRLECDGHKSIAPEILATAKMKFNSVTSTPGSHYVTLEIKDFCCGHLWKITSADISPYDCYQKR